MQIIFNGNNNKDSEHKKYIYEWTWQGYIMTCCSRDDAKIDMYRYVCRDTMNLWWLHLCIK